MIKYLLEEAEEEEEAPRACGDPASIRRHDLLRSGCPGGAYSDIGIAGNRVRGNAGHGVEAELSGGKPYTQTIAADIAALNGTAGLFGDAGGVYNVSRCDAWNNGSAADLDYAGAYAELRNDGCPAEAGPSRSGTELCNELTHKLC